LKKYKIIALLLNLLIGTGYIYIGKVKKAFFFLFAPILLLILGSFLEQYIDYSLLLSLFLLAVLYLYSFIDIWKSFPIKNEERLKYSRWYYVVLFIVFSSVIQLFIADNKDMLATRQFSLPASSMNNTLFKGDYIVARKSHDVHRGDIAFFRNPLNPNIYFAKRVVALGNDEIIYLDKKLFIHFKEGDAYIKEHFPSSHIYTIRKKLWVENPYLLSNSNIIYQPKQYNVFQILSAQQNSMSKVYIEELSKDKIYHPNSEEKFNAFYKKIEENSYFMMGDNRDNSNDSRFFGSVHKEYIYGVLKNVYFNYKTWDRFNIKVK